MKNRVKGSTTIEMAIIAPMILLVFMMIIYCIFYFHDKNILLGVANEVASVGSMKMRTEGEEVLSELDAFLSERIQKKCILLQVTDYKIKVLENEVYVSIYAKKKQLKVRVERRMEVARVEKEIRRRTNWKELLQ
ncbi:hypothetical protein M2454_000945 [Aequitasia blattaphilus]|uniref:Pilus assembly protein n=1 Tax=Aequitasia blattaphilus TaxID=2949332 RepID=A0ABT1E9F4_9FIRM|nr:TadE family protein [Aequitasia blattaphilus]MCP1102447.1 pilus assembly protein [Aequitasia blattaphilus]MCR8615087.1 pilus assembly protein [Aequitasia blattaphilus]